jgi:hypothetical protein
MISGDDIRQGQPFRLPGAPPPPPKSYSRLSTLLQQYQVENEMLLKHQLGKSEKDKEVLTISDTLLQLNNHIIAQKYRLQIVETDISAFSKIIDYTNSNLKRIAGEIEVRVKIILTTF